MMKSRSSTIYILGISAFYHDSAACLLKDGVVVAAAAEERFTRKKHDSSLPINAIRYCLESQGITAAELSLLAFYDKPFLKFSRILETYLQYAPKGLRSFLKAMPLWIKQKLWLKDTLRRVLGYKGEIIFPEHHLSHAASAFYPSPFERAAFLTIDGVGELSTTSFGRGRGKELDIIADIGFPHSIGLLYSAFTHYLGFKVNSGEFKVMGLAPYGKPGYKDVILSELMDLKKDGSFRLDMEYFNYCTGLTMTGEKFHSLFGGPPRVPDSELLERHMDIAASIQSVTEELVLRMARHVREITDEPKLVMAGGVALNSVANGRLLREAIFDKIWIQPAAGDSGGALGAAFLAWHEYHGAERMADGNSDLQRGSKLGPEYADAGIKAYLDAEGIAYEELGSAELVRRVAALISGGCVVGWFQGRMEFGPRALGSRSILAGAASFEMRDKINRIKHRERFRPLAPAVMAERAGEYFDINCESPYMLMTAQVREERLSEVRSGLKGMELLGVPLSDIGAVTHVDGSARLQTVSRKDDPLFYSLLSALDKESGMPVVVNTSLNLRGEPIVATPRDAYNCFMNSELEWLAIGGFLLGKNGGSKIR